jgi:hypothetical protein
MPLLQVLAYAGEALPIIEKAWQWWVNRSAQKQLAATTKKT